MIAAAEVSFTACSFTKLQSASVGPSSISLPLGEVQSVEATAAVRVVGGFTQPWNTVGLSKCGLDSCSPHARQLLQGFDGSTSNATVEKRHQFIGMNLGRLADRHDSR